MKNKLLSILLCLSIIMALAACGSDDGNNNQTTPEATATLAPTATEAPTSTPTPTAEPTEAPTATPTEIPEPVLDSYTINDFVGEWYMQKSEIEGYESTAIDEGIFRKLTINADSTAEFIYADWYQLSSNEDITTYSNLELKLVPATTESHTYLTTDLVVKENGDASEYLIIELADNGELLVNYCFYYDETIPVGSLGYYTHDEITLEMITPEGQGAATFIPFATGNDEYIIYSDEDYSEKINVSAPYIEIYKGYEDVNTYITDAISSFSSDMKKYGLSSLDEATYMKENMDEGQVAFNNSTLSVMRCDTKLFSCLLTTNSYYGGAHPDTYVTAYNYSGISGVLLVLDDIIYDKEQLKSILIEKLTAEYPDASFFDLEGTIEAEVNDGSIKFVICNDNVTFYFSPYELASYADGIISTSLSYNEYSGIMSPSYLPGSASFSLIANLDTSYYLDFDNDGDIDKLQVYGSLDEYGDYSNIIFVMNNEIVLDQELPLHAYSMNQYLMRTEDGTTVMYFETTGASEDSTIHGFKFANGSVEYIGVIAEAFAGYLVDANSWDASSESKTLWLELAFDPYDIVTTETNYLLGTRFLLCEVAMDNNGNFVNTNEYKFFSSPTALTLLCDLEVNELDENGDATGQIITLPAGTEVYPGRIYGEHLVGFYLNDNSLIEYDLYGCEVDKIFDGILYAD